MEARLEETNSSVVGQIGPESRRAGAAQEQSENVEARRSPRRLGGAWLALAASAVLALGVGLGRWSSQTSEEASEATPVAVSPAEREAFEGNRNPGATAARLAAVETLVRSEPLLATVKAEASRGAVDAEVGEWARKILGDTRFLLDSGLPLDPQVRSLLEDLELVLLQATLVGAGGLEGPRAREELELLRQGMDDKDVLTRIQAVVPGPASGI